jgi:hypothetical protein
MLLWNIQLYLPTLQGDLAVCSIADANPNLWLFSQRKSSQGNSDGHLTLAYHKQKIRK